MGDQKLRNNSSWGMSLSRATLAAIALVAVLVQGEKPKDELAPEVMFTQQGFSYEETGADIYDANDSTLKGQSGLAGKISAAHLEEEHARRKSDGLDGEFVLSSVGIQGGAKAPEDPTSDDFGEMTLVQQIPDDNLWTPSGQPGLADDVYKANEEAKKKKPRDDPTDIGDLFVQLPTKQQWNAHGQS